MSRRQTMWARLGHLHARRQPEFEAYNAWRLQIDANELCLSPAAFSGLNGQPRARYPVVGWVEGLGDPG